MSFAVKSLGCAAGRQPASRLSSSTHAGVGCETIAGQGRTHAAAEKTHLGNSREQRVSGGTPTPPAKEPGRHLGPQQTQPRQKRDGPVTPQKAALPCGQAAVWFLWLGFSDIPGGAWEKDLGKPSPGQRSANTSHGEGRSGLSLFTI